MSDYCVECGAHSSQAEHVRNDPAWQPPGAQQTVDGKTWTLARYDLAMWVPTDDAEKALRYLAGLVAARFDNVTEQFDLESWVQAKPERYEQSAAILERSTR